MRRHAEYLIEVGCGDAVFRKALLLAFCRHHGGLFRLLRLRGCPCLSTSTKSTHSSRGRTSNTGCLPTHEGCSRGLRGSFSGQCARPARTHGRVAGRGAGREARGLVSLSTTCKADGSGLSVVDFVAENTIEIDHQKARITRMQKAWVSRQKHCTTWAKNQRVWMLTLTYAGTNRNWRPEHISRYLDGLRKWHYSRTGIKKFATSGWQSCKTRRHPLPRVCVAQLWPDPPKPDSAWKRRAHFKRPCGRMACQTGYVQHIPLPTLMKYASKGTSEGRFPWRSHQWCWWSR